ncbi:MAG: redoxin domain-containing protein [Demequinaceae bacterium]|nr:redoxin domain-containing protein [Demequinaceae bacterium]
MTHPLVGRLAPDFTLTNTQGKPITLTDLRGTPVLLVFAPWATSEDCTKELCEIRDSGELKKARNVHILVVSCESLPALKLWGEIHHYQGDLLSDFWPHGEVARWYGIFNPRRGISVRASFLIAADGVVKWAVVHAPDDPRDIDEYMAAIHEL